jgi:ribosomal protein S18 acetylase RimI-like enzyme
MTTAALQVRPATLEDVDAVAPLFQAYREFYGRTPGGEAAFLRERLVAAESRVFIAEAGAPSTAAGFAQVYPTFSSVRLRPVWILNDLYVAPEWRRRGVAAALLDAVEVAARAAAVVRLELETAPDNGAARSLYESRGWTVADGMVRYGLELDGKG